jgi:ribosomal-protein-serine acetyltransferase
MLDFALMQDVRLRLFEERDADELYRLIDDNRERLARWMPWALPQTLDGTRQFIRRTRQQLADDNGMQTALTVGGRIAGVVGVHGISWELGNTSVRYWLGAEFEGRGAMTAAVRAYVDHAFGPWTLHRLELRADVENAKSCAIAERLGFTREGVLRSCAAVGDRRPDHAVYSVLASEWARTSP